MSFKILSSHCDDISRQEILSRNIKKAGKELTDMATIPSNHQGINRGTSYLGLEVSESLCVKA